jgi:hypothetical protein
MGSLITRHVQDELRRGLGTSVEKLARQGVARDLEECLAGVIGTRSQVLQRVLWTALVVVDVEGFGVGTSDVPTTT